MGRYMVLKEISVWDSTLKKEDADTVEYPVNAVPFEKLGDARKYLMAQAEKCDMGIRNCGLIAVKENEKIDEETGIIYLETERLRIERRSS